MLATAVFLPIGAMPEDQLLSWGWRVPFWLSAAVVVVGLFIRRRLDEPPAFREEIAERSTPRVPTGELFRDHWSGVLRVTLAAIASTVSTIFAVYALSFAVDTKGLDQTTMLWVMITTNVVALAAIPLWASLSDRIGRKPVFIFGAVGSGALMFAYLAAIESGSYPLIFLAGICMSGVVYSAMNGIQPSLYGEMFPTRVRLSGMAIGTQIGYAIGGFAPTAAAAIDREGSAGWVPVAVYVLCSSIIAAIAVITARETHRVPLHEIDGRAPLAPETFAPAEPRFSREGLRASRTGVS